MKKTIQAKKLKLSSTTLRTLSSADLADARGALQDTNTCKFCGPAITVGTCSCKNSVCNSCYNSDCCLMEP